MIVEVAATNEATYLPLHERQIEELHQADPPPIPYREVTPTAVLGVLAQHAETIPAALPRPALQHPFLNLERVVAAAQGACVPRAVATDGVGLA